MGVLQHLPWTPGASHSEVTAVSSRRSVHTVTDRVTRISSNQCAVGGRCLTRLRLRHARAHGESSLLESAVVMLNSVSSVTSRANSFVNLFFIESVAAAVGRGRNDSAHDSALPCLVVGDGVVTGVLDLPLRGLQLYR